MTTWAERFDTVASAIRAFWWVALAVGLAVVVLLFARACNAASEAQSALARANEKAIAEKLGLTVIHDAKEAAQDAKIKAMSMESAGFKAAWEAAEAKLKARPVIVVQASTGPVPLSGPEVVHSGKPVDTGGNDGSGLPGATACRLGPGDQGEILVRAAVRQAKEGTRDVVGHAQAFRVSPRELLFEGAFSAPVTEAIADPIPLVSRPGWGGGLGGGIATSGPIGSALIVTPPFFAQHLEAAGIISAGHGLFAGQVAIIYRP